MKSPSVASHVELSSAVVSQVMSFVRSLLSLLPVAGCRYALMSSSRFERCWHYVVDPWFQFVCSSSGI